MNKARVVVKPAAQVWLDKARSLLLGKLIKSGGAGSVYLLPDAPTQVAKLYHPHLDREKNRRKIEAMLELSPELPDQLENGKRYIQIAWPQSALQDAKGRFIGFAMPLLDMAHTAELEQIMQERQARAAGLPTGLGAKLTLAANLAGVLEALHQQQHYVVDLKPVNLRFYRDSLYIAMLDCDGFSIQGRAEQGRAERFPAEQFTADYLAPEFQRKGMQAGSESTQDRFALAVVIFQLLNFGIHPYSGRAANAQVATDLPGRIRDGCYAYGVQPNKSIAPNTTSGHALMPPDVRAMFDRAFSNSPRAVRPSPLDWQQLLRPYAQKSGGLLTVCAVNPEHQHFTGFACAACAREQLIAQAAQQQTMAQAQSQARVPARAGRRRTAPAAPVSTPLPVAGTPVSGKGWVAVVVIIVLLLIGFSVWTSTPDKVAERTAEQTQAEEKASLEKLDWRERKPVEFMPSDARQVIRNLSQALKSGDDSVLLRGMQWLYKAGPSRENGRSDRVREQLRESLIEGPGWLPGVRDGMADQMRDLLIEKPRDYLASAALGRIHLAFNEPVAARQYFEQSVWARPTDGVAWIGLAATALRAGDEAEAVNFAGLGFATAQRFAIYNELSTEPGEAPDNGVERTERRMERAGKILLLAMPRTFQKRWETVLADGQALAGRIAAKPDLPATRAAVALPSLPALVLTRPGMAELQGENALSISVSEGGAMTAVVSDQPMDPRINKLLIDHLKKWPYVSAIENGQIRSSSVEVLLRYRDGKMVFTLPAPLPEKEKAP